MIPQGLPWTQSCQRQLYSAPRGGVSNLALPALAWIQGRTGGISRGTSKAAWARSKRSLRPAPDKIPEGISLAFRVVPQRSEERSRHTFGNKSFNYLEVQIPEFVRAFKFTHIRIQVLKMSVEPGYKQPFQGNTHFSTVIFSC